MCFTFIAFGLQAVQMQYKFMNLVHMQTHKHTQLRIHYITPVHNSSRLNIRQPNHYTACQRPARGLPVGPFSLSLIVPYQRSPLLLYVAMFPGASATGWDATIKYNSYGAQLANMQRQDDMAICSSSLFPHSREFPYHFNWGVTDCVMPVCVIPDILTVYQHNWGSCQVGPWITFHWCCWPDWLRYRLHSGETQAFCLPRKEENQSITDRRSIHTGCADTCKTKSTGTILVCKHYRTDGSHLCTLSWRKFQLGFYNHFVPLI